MAKNNVPKSVMISQLSISKLTFNNILRSDGKFKIIVAQNEELGSTLAAKLFKKK